MEAEVPMHWNLLLGKVNHDTPLDSDSVKSRSQLRRTRLRLLNQTDIFQKGSLCVKKYMP